MKKEKFLTFLQKVLNTSDLISLGVGSCGGTGMYLVSGMVAKTMAGPGVVLSFTIAGFAALLSGLCYAELGVRVPYTTGSAYEVRSKMGASHFKLVLIGLFGHLVYLCDCGRIRCLCGWLEHDSRIYHWNCLMCMCLIGLF